MLTVLVVLVHVTVFGKNLVLIYFHGKIVLKYFVAWGYQENILRKCMHVTYECTLRK